MSPLEGLLVLGCGVVAGAVNAVAGGGTLLAFPVLLAVGLPAVQANTTTSVGLVVGYAGAARAYRPELAGQRARAKALLVPGVLGALVGATLLLWLPGDSFRAVVPYLLLLACGLIAAQPRLARALTARGVGGEHPTWQLRLAVGCAAVYGAYFGGALGVILFAVLGLLLPDAPLRMNALRGLTSLTVNLVGSLVFVVTGHVHWLAALLLGAGAWTGATYGVRLARRLPPQGVRAAVVAVGVGVALALIATG